MSRRIWLVEGYDSTNRIYRGEFTIGQFNERSMSEFLRRLLCRFLTFQEIAELSRKRKPKESRGEFEVNIDATRERFIMSVGSNPYFTAIAREPQ